MAEKLDEIRPITCKTGLLPRTHGSSLFTRGQTQALGHRYTWRSVDMQIMDELGGEYKESFMLHYNFPGFATGEAKPERGLSRREMGHGALARRSLLPLLPTEDDFPYAIRIVSDILESNGSSSMASVCGGSLALFDAGVPIKSSCAGIAMGLIKEGEQIRNSYGYNGNGRPSWRHGFQGCRDQQRNHCSSDGHKNIGPYDRDYGRST